MEKTSKEVSFLLQELADKKREADATKALVKEEEATAKKEAESAKLLAEGAEQHLQAVLPTLDNATKALNKISRKDITEIRVSLKSVQVPYLIELFTTSTWNASCDRGLSDYIE